MIDLKTFNAYKTEAYQTKTKEDYDEWKKNFTVWWRGQEIAPELKENLLKQIKDLDEKKNAYFDKYKNKPQVIKNNYIFREEEGEAFIALCNTLIELVNFKIGKQ